MLAYILTDHSLQIPILNSHHLNEVVNPCLQRLKTRLIAYNFTAEWQKSSQNDAPDALSGNPVSDPQPQDMLAKHDIYNQPGISIREIKIDTDDGHDSPHLWDLRRCAANDEEYQQLLNTILSGFPDHRSQLPEPIQHYWHVREHLTVDDNLIVHGCRLLIPTSMRKQVLSELHDSHQGAVHAKKNAHLTVYWPCIDNDIENIVISCKQCQPI